MLRGAGVAVFHTNKPYQSRSAANTTMVVTASSTVKVWLKKVPKSQTKPKDLSTVAPPTSGISMTQLVAILFLTILVNVFVTHYKAIVRPCLAFFNSWMLTTAELFTVCMLTTIGLSIADTLFQGTTTLKTAGNFTVEGADFSVLD